MILSVYRRYLLPGVVFQSVVIAGGYGTGRELIEFFLTQGPVGGLLAMGVSAVIWSAVAAASFEFARTFRTLEYRTFFRHLLGRWWVLFEICFVALLLVVGAVIGAAAGSILEETFGLPYAVGVAGILLAVAYLAFRGTAAIEKALTAWSAVLYLVYAVLFVWAFVRFGGAARAAFGADPIAGNWFIAGVRYAAYNIAMIPVILFSIRHVETRREAVTAGMLAGPIGMIPALLFYLAIVAFYPGVLDRPVPVNFLLEQLGARWFQITYQIMLFGTLIESGIGMIHALNERIAVFLSEKGGRLPDAARPIIAIAFLSAAALLARVGLTALIARGYGTLTWAFLIVFVVPVLTVGIWKIRGREQGEGGRERPSPDT
jgi:uncharacterized membrane protein YkvI